MNEIRSPLGGTRIERKVAAGAGAAAVTGVIAWALTSFMFHGDLPVAISDLINWLVPTVFGAVSAYLARHTPRPDVKES